MLHSTTEWQSIDSRHFALRPSQTPRISGPAKGTRVITRAEEYLWRDWWKQIIGGGMAGSGV